MATTGAPTSGSRERLTGFALRDVSGMVQAKARAIEAVLRESAPVWRHPRSADEIEDWTVLVAEGLRDLRLHPVRIKCEIRHAVEDKLSSEDMRVDVVESALRRVECLWQQTERQIECLCQPHDQTSCPQAPAMEPIWEDIAEAAHNIRIRQPRAEREEEAMTARDGDAVSGGFLNQTRGADCSVLACVQVTEPDSGAASHSGGPRAKLPRKSAVVARDGIRRCADTEGIVPDEEALFGGTDVAYSQPFRGSPADPQAIEEGAVVWARVEGEPWWPAMVFPDWFVSVNAQYCLFWQQPASLFLTAYPHAMMWLAFHTRRAAATNAKHGRMPSFLQAPLLSEEEAMRRTRKRTKANAGPALPSTQHRVVAFLGPIAVNFAVLPASSACIRQLSQEAPFDIADPPWGGWPGGHQWLPGSQLRVAWRKACAHARRLLNKGEARKDMDAKQGEGRGFSEKEEGSEARYDDDTSVDDTSVIIIDDTLA